MEPLTGKRIAILVHDGFAQADLASVRQILDAAAAATEIVSSLAGRVRGWDHQEWDGRLAVGARLGAAEPGGYDALFLPGGVLSTDALRASDDAVRFVRAFINAGKPIAALGHGPQLLIDADGVRGRTLTSHHAIRRDLINAGAEWIDEEVAIDRSLVTARGAADIPAFNRALLAVIAAWRLPGQARMSS